MKQMFKFNLEGQRIDAVDICLSASDIRRFEGYIKKLDNECWILDKGVDGDGYGTFAVKRRRYRAHRISAKIYKNVSIKGVLIRHSCDYRRCVNPDHLLIGSHLDNVNDRVERERSAMGGQNGRSKLKEEDIHDIREMINNGISNEKIANLFGVNRRAIYSIRHDITWKHLK